MAVEQQEATETLMYNFDYPALKESGQLKIGDNCIILQFPEKPTIYVEDSIKIRQNITLYMDNKHCFSLDWIPMHTWIDYYRVKDMIEKCLQAYSNLTGNTCFSPHTFICSPVKYYESVTTNFTANTFSLSSFEHLLDTCIQLSLVDTENNEKETPLHFQLCIGKHIVFCTERDLKCVTQASNVHFIVQFILHKILSVFLL
jgi:hypothetical protein